MRETLERKPNSLEQEADSYIMKADFSPQQILAEAETYSGHAYLDFAISKDKHIICFSLHGHAQILREHHGDDLESGGKAWLNNDNPDKKFVIERIDGVAGSLAFTSERDLGLARVLIKKYLAKIKV